VRAPIALTRRGQRRRDDGPDKDAEALDAPTNAFPPDPLARIERVARGIAELADDLESTGLDAHSLRQWSLELTLTRTEIHQAVGLTGPSTTVPSLRK
jgi:hypothetical protein